MRYFIQFLLVLASPVLLAQTIWVADNNVGAPTGPYTFPTVQEAVDAAAPGDIVQIQPSPTVYGAVTIRTKNLTLMGIGFNVDKETPLTSVLDNIVLSNNAANDSDADGAIIKDLQFRDLVVGVNTGPAFLLQNVLVQNCLFNSVYTYQYGSYSPVDSLEIRGCQLGALNFYFGVSNSLFVNNLIDDFNLRGAADNITIANNIIYGGIYIVSESGTSTIVNNNFIGATATETAFNWKLKYTMIANNIFYGSTPSIGVNGSFSNEFAFNTFSNNLVYATGDDTMPPTGGTSGTDNNGLNNLLGNPNFVNGAINNTWSAAYDFTLQAGSPALGAGSDGLDIGISGGNYPFPGSNLVLKTAAAPVIQILNTAGLINPGDDLPVRIKAKSN
jgi:hypothetical protein